jgi:hypothetical protein
VWARCSAPRQRVCGFMEHGCGQALSVHVHEEGMRLGERAVSPVLLGVCRAVAGNSLWAACIAASSYAMWAASAREHSLM